MKLAEFLLNCPDDFNGHKQTDLGKISMKDAVNLLGELEDACVDSTDIFSLELYRDGSFSIIQKGYWDMGEHPIGHTDRLICSGMIDLKREEPVGYFVRTCVEGPSVSVEHERKLFEARMRRVAPGVNLEMIGDRYNELDTQWKFELWLDRAAIAGKGVK